MASKEEGERGKRVSGYDLPLFFSEGGPMISSKMDCYLLTVRCVYIYILLFLAFISCYVLDRVLL